MSSFRFVHAADLHLDSPLRRLFNQAPEVATSLQSATFAAFDSIVALCLEKRVDALLIAGDIYNAAERSLGAQLHFIDGLRKLDAAGIRSFVCHGNHDPLSGWEAGLEFPPLVHRFTAEVECVPVYPDAPASPVVCGVSYPRRTVRENLIPRFPAPQPGVYTIGLVHANVGTDTGHEPYAPCTLEDLIDTRYDYWALGHVHTRAVLRDHSPTIVYPGNPQAIQPNEQGERGVYLVEVADDHRTELTFWPVDTVRWERLSISIGDLEGEQSLIDAVESAVETKRDAIDDRSLVYRLSIVGRGSLHESVGRDRFCAAIEERLNELWVRERPFAFCERIDDRTLAPIDRDARREAGDFVGDLLRLVDGLAGDDDALLDLQSELVDLFRHARAGRFLRDELPSQAEMRTLLSAAEGIAVDLLIGDEDGVQ